jgi:predicted nuclease of predicted toxin-antitoxin system
LKILFDQNVPRALFGFLTGHDVIRAAELNWEELRNGELLLQAEAHGFDALITCDRNLEYQQRVTGRKIGIIALSTNNWPLIRKRVAAVVNAVNVLEAGAYIAVDCGIFQRKRRMAAKS